LDVCSRVRKWGGVYRNFEKVIQFLLESKIRSSEGCKADLVEDCLWFIWNELEIIGNEVDLYVRWATVCDRCGQQIGEICEKTVVTNPFTHRSPFDFDHFSRWQFPGSCSDLQESTMSGNNNHTLRLICRRNRTFSENFRIWKSKCALIEKIRELIDENSESESLILEMCECLDFAMDISILESAAPRISTSIGIG
jgi:hypothetical protein